MSSPGPDGPIDTDHQDWFVETEAQLAGHVTEQCVQCFEILTAADCQDGLCPDCQVRGLPGRSILEEVRAARRKTRNWLLLLAIVLMAFALLRWLVS